MKKLKEKHIGATIRDHHGNWIEINYDNVKKLEYFSHLFEEEKRKPRLTKKKKDAESNKGNTEHDSNNANGASDSE